MSTSMEFGGLKRRKTSKGFGGLKRCNFVEVEDEDDEVFKEVDEVKEYPDWFIEGRCDYGEGRLASEPKKLQGLDIDVISLLFNKGETNHLVKSNGEIVGLEASVLGKYVVICCVSLPMYQADISEDAWRAMIDTYTYTYSHKSPSFEMVVAVTIKQEEEKEEASESVFNSFMSEVPCLAIPFSDLETRKSICSFIGFGTRHTTDSTRSVSAIVVSPTGRILRHARIPTNFFSYGSQCFTSTERELEMREEVLRCRLDPFRRRLYDEETDDGRDVLRSDDDLSLSLSLAKDILLCDPSDVLYRFSPSAGESLTVSQLSNRNVGLYLCINMSFLQQLKRIQDECIANKQELEIVLVSLPVIEKPTLYFEKLRRLVHCVKSWLYLPYKNMVSRRLWHVFGYESTVDRFVVLPPNCNNGELSGRSVAQYYIRVHMHAYPFTRSAALEHKFATLKSVTPATLLFKGGVSQTHTCLVQSYRDEDSSCFLPQSAIKGKKLLLYFGSIKDTLSLDDCSELCRLLMEHYPKIQAMDCEVVFIPFDRREKRRHKETMMPWPMMPVKAAVDAWPTLKLLLEYNSIGGCYDDHLITLKEDGGVLSTRAWERLREYGASDLLFCDALRIDITEELQLLETADDEYI